MRQAPAISGEEGKRPWPAWAASLVLHAALLLILTLTLQVTPRGISGDRSTGIAGEITGEIVLKHFSEQGEYYESQDQVKTPATPQSAPSSADLLNNGPQVTPSVLLPAGDVGVPTPGGNAGTFGSEGLTANPSQPRAGSGTGTKTRFYVESEGNSFVFVIDRSASMEHAGRLLAAKAELMAALKCLKDGNQFRIIFYNGDMDEFRPRGKLAFFADGPTMKQAENYIRGVLPDGPSDGFHRALRAAVAYHFDVIYFLTDAEDIYLSDAELGILRRMNRGASIHVIKFGEGAEERVPWLVKLARDNAGKYQYVDVKSLRAE